ALHKDASEAWDWPAFAKASSPPKPERSNVNEERALAHRTQNREWQDGALQNIRSQQEQIAQFEATSHPLDRGELQRFRARKRELESKLEDMKRFSDSTFM